MYEHSIEVLKEERRVVKGAIKMEEEGKMKYTEEGDLRRLKGWLEDLDEAIFKLEH